MTGASSRFRFPAAYRQLLASPQTRLLLAGLGVSAIGVAGWGVCLLPFAGAPIPVTLVFFGIGGVIYAPFVPLTYAMFQAATTTENLPAVLAARSAVVMVSTPLGTALGGPIVAALGGSGTLFLSGVATVVLAAAGAVAWREQDQDRVRVSIGN